MKTREQLINEAIDAILETESAVFHHGLPPELRAALDRLRSERSAIEFQQAT